MKTDLPAPVEDNCPLCGEAMPTIRRGNRIYCSRECTVYVAHERQAKRLAGTRGQDARKAKRTLETMRFLYDASALYWRSWGDVPDDVKGCVGHLRLLASIDCMHATSCCAECADLLIANLLAPGTEHPRMRR